MYLLHMIFMRQGLDIHAATTAATIAGYTV
jgi:hypothetical protein